MPGAIRRVPEDLLRQAASMSAVCKINIDSDLRLAMTGVHPRVFRPASGRFRSSSVSQSPRVEAIKEMVAHKIVDVLGCDGKA